MQCANNSSPTETGFHYTMSLIQGKRKMDAPYALMEFRVVRFNELKWYLRGVLFKMLKGLEDGCVTQLKRLENRINILALLAEFDWASEDSCIDFIYISRL